MYTWIVFAAIMLFSVPSFAQDSKATDNKAKIRQNKAKSVKRKEKASTKDIAGKRLRTKNANSVAGRAVYSNPSPYANERRGKDRASKPIDGQPLRIRSRSAKSARNNVYPQRGPFVNRSSTKTETGKSNRSRYARSGRLTTPRTTTAGTVSPPRSRTRSAESSRANAYPEKGPFVNRSSKGSENSAGRNRFSRAGRLSASGRTTKSISANVPRSHSTSAESSRGNRFQQSGRYVSRSPRNTESVSSRSSRFSRRTTLSAGPTPPGKKRTVTPRSASQQYVTRGRKDVYWGKFSKGERAITTDVSGNPLRRRNYRTPPNEIIQQKNPYADRKKASGDRAYSGTFKSGHASRTKQTEKAWMGDVSGQPLRKRASRQGEVAGKRLPPSGPSSVRNQRGKGIKGIRPLKGAGGSISARGEYRSNQPVQGRIPGIGVTSISKGQQRIKGTRSKSGGGSISAKGKYRSNQPLGAGGGSISASGKYRSNQPLRGGGGSISASGKYRSNQPFRNGGGSISASGKYRSNKPFSGRTGVLSVSGKNRTFDFQPKGGGSISASGKYRSNQPFKGGGGSISASGKYRSNKPFTGRAGALSVSGNNRTYDFQPKGGGSISASGKYRSNKPFKGGGGSISASGKYRSNKPFDGRVGALSVSGQNRTYDFKPKGGGSMSGRVWNNNNQPIAVRTPGIGGSALARYQNKLNPKKSTKEFSQGGLVYYKGSGAERARKGTLGSGEKIWNNNNRPLPSPNYGNTTDKISTFQGNVKLKESSTGVANLFRRSFVRNPNAAEEALKKKNLFAKVNLPDGLQLGVKAKQTGTKPKAAKGSMPGLAPSKATVKASEYSRTMKVYWSYKHNPSSADAAQKTFGPSKSFNRASAYAGRTRLTKNYRHNPMSDKNSLKVIAPGRAYARVTDYQGNIKMRKYNDKKFLPDSKFAHSKGNNVKDERTIMTDFKLLWTKLFKKNGTQPDAVKEKSIRPRYDKRERELWPGLYD
ncbi:MAG: hypothetical protein RI909_203 [Bacteroidota bacterium]